MTQGLFGLSHPSVTRDSSSLMIYESLGGCLGYQIPMSPVTAVRWSPKGVFRVSNPRVTRVSSSLMISESLRGSFGLLNTGVTRDSGSLIFLSPKGVFGLWNPRVTWNSSSLMIFDSLGAVGAVESMRHPWVEFVDDFWVPRAVRAV